MSSEHGTQGAVGRLWKEREEREGGESAGERERERGKRARRGAGCSRNRAFQALGIQVRPGGCAAPPGSGERPRLPTWLFSCGMLKDCTQRESLKEESNWHEDSAKMEGLLSPMRTKVRRMSRGFFILLGG